jgi:hypothetical protein
MKELFLTIAILLALPLHAEIDARRGGVNGGGGNGVVCRNGNNIVSVELLDLYESRILYNRDYDSMEHMELDEALRWASQKLYSYDLPSVETQFYLFKTTQSKFHLLPPGVRLDPINDSGHIFIPSGCKIEQVANFYNNEKVFVVSDFYNKMDTLNKAALIVHEAVYLKERTFSVTDSRYSRRLVGAIFDRDFVFNNPIPGINPYRRTTCYTPTGKIGGDFNYEFNPGLKKVTAFDIVSTGKDSTRMYFTMLNGHTVYSSKHMDIFHQINPNWIERGRASDESFGMGFNLVSNFDGGERFDIQFSQIDATRILSRQWRGHRINQIKGSWTGSDPGDSFQDLEFICATIEIN